MKIIEKGMRKMNIKSSLEYKDYYISISDEGGNIDIIVNFTVHQNKRSSERNVPIETVLESIQEKEIQEVLYLKNGQHAVIRDFKRNISYVIEMYCDYDIVMNVITSLNKTDMRIYEGEKTIIINKIA
ncbi:hypothetical protein [Clostridium felsineum]|uniref:hypothetical protein n=1 Tax=Clostridium felsineum TaxID=36839 RepID=UPI00214D2C38|nr:hypothetical protein [Clostridium felsineum]